MTARRARLLIPVLVLLAAAGAAVASPSAPAGAAAWEEGQALLDAGRPARAVAHFGALLGEGGAMAEGFVAAAARLCREDSALAALATVPSSGDSAATARLEALRLRRAFRWADAARAGERAAALAAAEGDTLGRLVALLAAAQAHLRAEDHVATRTLCDRLDALTPAGEAGSRLRAEVALTRAGVHYLAGRQATADSLYEDLLARATARGWRQIACDALNARASIRGRARAIGEAGALYRRALAEARRLGDPQRQALILINLAYERTEAQELAAARRDLEEARALAARCGQAPLLASVLTGLGAAADAAGDRDAAIARFREAVRASVALGSERGELAARQRLAYDLLQIGEYREAAACYERCLQITQRLRTTHVLNWILGGLALAHHHLGELEAAEASYRRALAVNEQLGDRMSAAWCLDSIGLIHSLRGDYQQALVHHHRARDLCATLGDGAGESRSRANIADVLLRLGDPDAARAEGERALALAEASGSGVERRAAAGVLAAVYEAAGRPDLAADHHRRALALARRWRDKLAIIDALNELARSCLARGRPAEARPLLAEAASLLAPQGEYAVRAQTRLLQARCAADPAAAAALAGEALAAAREGGLPEKEWQALSDLGALALAAGDTGDAQARLEAAVEVAESLRRQVGLDELRRRMLGPAHEPYERLVALLVARGDAGPRAAEALAVADRWRALLLAERLRAARPGPDPALPDSPAAAESDLLAAIAHAQARLQDGSLDPVRRRSLHARVRALEQAFADLRLRLSSRDAARADELYPAADRPDSLLSALRPGERLLFFSLGADASFLFSATRDGARAHRLPPAAEIEAKARLFLGLLAPPAGAPVPASVTAEAARGLHDLLLGPAAGDIRPGETLVFVPDGLLHRLPPALLRTSRGWLVEEHEFYVAPSLRALRQLRARAAQRRAAGDVPRLSLLAVGCEGDDPAGPRVNPFTGEPLVPLRHAAAEAAQVAALFRGSLLLAGPDASEGRLRASPLAEAAVLHVAAHGFADETDVRRSFLVLAPGAGADSTSAWRGAGPRNDGLLQWHEAAALPLRASLVTLASCRSAGGALARAEGVTGLTQAFLHAGAGCVLAAQADVPDSLARAVMLAFYRRLRGGAPAALALRGAQREAAVAGAPLAWAGFVLVGDGAATLARASPGWPRLALAGLGVAALAALAAWRVSCVIRARRGV